MWYALFFVSAFGAQLEVDVVVEASPPRLKPPRPGPAPPVPLGRGAVRVDGRLDEIAWQDAPEAPPLGPWLNGPAAPDVHSRVVRAEEGLALAAWNLPEGMDVRWVVDPDGTGAAWTLIDLGSRAVRTRRCSLSAVDLPPGAVVAARAVPCVPEMDVRVGGGDGAWEVLLPYASLGRFTSSARILLSVGTPDEGGGTWAPFGKGDAVPALGRPVDLGPAPGSLAVALAADGAWDLTLTLGPDDPLGIWEIRRLRHGREVDVVRQTVAKRGETLLHLAAVEGSSVVVEASIAEGDGVWYSIVRSLGPDEARVWVRSPVAEGALELGWSTPGPAMARLEVLTPRGRLLGEAEVELPRGGGRLVVPVTWRAPEVVVRLEGLLEPTVVVTSR